MRMNAMKKMIARIHHDDTGAMTIEKVLLIVVIVIPIVIALVAFRKQLLNLFKGKSEKVLKEGR